MDSVRDPNTPPEAAWHSLTGEGALELLGSTLDGLSVDEARKRQGRYGRNVIQRQSRAGPVEVLWGQINNPLIWVLLGSGLLAVGLGKITDGAVVLGVVVINTIIGFVQEYRAAQAIEALAQMVPERATVIRAGERATVEAQSLVPGDVVVLASGDRVPADVRLLSVRNLRADEAALTGESLPVDKGTKPVADDEVVGDRICMLYGGTMITYGTGTGVVVTTGGNTQLGRISKMMDETAELGTPLTRSLASIAKVLTVAILAISVVLMLIGLARGYPLADAALVAITLAVAAIPEGLPAIVTIALAIAVRRMANQNAIMRKLPAVETLGSTTVICSDKTGTLTRNEMTVRAMWVPGGRYEVTGIGYEPDGTVQKDGATLEAVPNAVARLLEAAVLCNDATLSSKNGAASIQGDPTEGALVVLSEKLGLSTRSVRESSPRVDLVPFESEHRLMATLDRAPHGLQISVKGAPEALLPRCADVDADVVRAEVERMAAAGMRVLAIASKPGADDQSRVNLPDLKEGLTLLGLLGMIDPPRPEAIAAIQRCRTAGVAVKMITGDHGATASAIGRQLGILEAGSTVTGAELVAMNETQLRQAARSSNVFARVAPEHKLALVRALQDHGEVVAMTGDGVNDAPALKQANIGVAMGITGTSVSREASDMVLADDNFATIAAAVEEGRRVYDNLVKSLAFVLPTNIGLALVLMAAVPFFPMKEVAGKLMPLTPMQPTQILWINLVAAVALALPLAFESKERNVMKRPPRSPTENILGPLVVRRTVFAAVMLATGALGLFSWEYARELQRMGSEMAAREAQTMAVTTVIAFQCFYLMSSRSLCDSVFRIGLFSNPMVFLGIGAVVLLQAAFLYLPPMNTVFGSLPLDFEALALSSAAGAIIIPMVTFDKWLCHRRRGADPDEDGDASAAAP